MQDARARRFREIHFCHRDTEAQRHGGFFLLIHFLSGLFVCEQARNPINHQLFPSPCLCVSVSLCLCGNCPFPACHCSAVLFHSVLTMLSERKFAGFGGNLRSGLIAVLVSLMLAVPLFAASPALHKYLHHDSADAHHSCFVCAFVKGQINTAETVLAVVLVFLGLAQGALLENFSLVPSSDIRLAPSRAPPVL
jgi:hypothetical protein